MVQVSFVEIYQDDIRDLLGEGEGHPINVRESPERGTFLDNVQCELPITCPCPRQPHAPDSC